MFSARRDARPGGSAQHQQQQPCRPAQVKSSKTATRHSDQQVQQVPASLTSFPPFEQAQASRDIEEYPNPIAAKRNSSQKKVSKPSEDRRQTNQESPAVAKKAGQEQAKSSLVVSASGPSSPPKSRPRPRTLSLSHVRRPSKSQLPTPNPRLSALGPMAAGIAADD